MSAPVQVDLLLVAPFWLGRAWFLDLMALLNGSPWEIPIRRDLFFQAAGSNVHPHPELWKLWVWPLRGHLLRPVNVQLGAPSKVLQIMNGEH